MATKLKLIQIGNSTGLILPKEMLEKLRVKKGDVLHALEIPDGFQLRAYDETLAAQLEVAEQVMRRRRNVLRKLAQ